LSTASASKYFSRNISDCNSLHSILILIAKTQFSIKKQKISSNFNLLLIITTSYISGGKSIKKINAKKIRKKYMTQQIMF